MNKNKKLIAIHLNEFNYEFLSKGAKKYECKNILKLLKLKRIKTYTSDKIQHKNLDPWVQSVSINTGTISKKHNITQLNQKLSNRINQIWDLLAKKNIKCGVWGTMNSIYRYHKNLKFFFPDPWNFKSKAYPEELNNYVELPKFYAQNYLDSGKFKFLKLVLVFLVRISFTNNFFYFLKNLPFFLSLFLKRGLKNYILFFIFDIISLNLFKTQVKKNKTNFSIIFLNSLAHFQHNNWDDKKIEIDYFLLTEKISKLIFEITEKKDSILLFNGFTQKKLKQNLY